MPGWEFGYNKSFVPRSLYKIIIDADNLEYSIEGSKAHPAIVGNASFYPKFFDVKFDMTENFTDKTVYYKCKFYDRVDFAMYVSWAAFYCWVNKPATPYRCLYVRNINDDEFTKIDDKIQLINDFNLIIPFYYLHYKFQNTTPKASYECEYEHTKLILDGKLPNLPHIDDWARNAKVPVYR